MDEENYLLYHYSNKLFSELLTVRTRIEKGDGSITEKFLELAEERDTYNEGILPYSKSISALIDKLPLDLIVRHFDKNKSPYLRGKYLYEYVIDLRTIQLDGWELLESKLEQKIWNSKYLEFLLDEEDLPTKAYLAIPKFARVIQGLTGRDKDKLYKVILKYKGTNRAAFINWINHANFQNEAGNYAVGIEHIKIYPKDGIIKPIAINKLELKQYE